MAATEAQLDTMLKDGARLIENLWTNQEADSDLDTLQDNLAGDSADDFLAAAKRIVDRTDDALTLTSDLIDAWSRGYMIHVLNKSPQNSDYDFAQTWRYWNDNNKTIRTRAITFGTKTGSTSGTGTVTRLSVDEFGEAIESEQASVKTLTCTKDASIGGADIHEEIFQFEDSAKRSLANLASGERRAGAPLYKARCSRNSLLRNSGFNEVTGGLTFAGSPSLASLASSNALVGWTFTSGTITDHQIDRTNYAETPLGTSNPQSFLAGAAFKISQQLRGTGTVNAPIDLDRPYHLSVWVRPSAAADGNVVLTLGDQTTTVAVSTLTDDTWNYVQFAVDETRWPRVWNTASASVALEWTGTAGTLGVDGLVFAPMGRFPTRSGTWWHIGAGAHGDGTAWVEGDTFTYTDTIASDSKIQLVLSLANRYLPAVANATEITAAGGRTLTFNDNGGSPDTITLSTGDVTSDGYEVGMILVVAGTSSNDGSYPITAVAATTISVATGSLTAEGPLSATATLNATPTITDPT